MASSLWTRTPPEAMAPDGQLLVAWHAELANEEDVERRVGGRGRFS